MRDQTLGTDTEYLEKELHNCCILRKHKFPDLQVGTSTGRSTRAVSLAAV